MQYTATGVVSLLTSLQRARVLREGELYEVLVEELVVGDIVDVTSGDIVPADIRIIRNNGLKVPTGRQIFLTLSNRFKY